MEYRGVNVYIDMELPEGNAVRKMISANGGFSTLMLGGVYPLVNVYKKLWKITIFNGKNQYKWPFSIAMLNYQRV